VLAAAIALLGAASLSPSMAIQPGTTLVPIGAGYTTATLEQFASEAVAEDITGNVYILVLPITFATDPFSISNGERQQNMTLAETRRGQVEAACEAVKAAVQTCDVILAEVLTRDDALDPSNAALVTADLDGVYILGGDQTIAMRVVANTPLEGALADAHAAGTVFGGNSAGAAVESVNMIAGYTGANGPETGLEQGAVDLWLFDGAAGDEERGLIFGLPETLLDQHVLQRGRIGRLINASFATGLLGLGVDADTAATIQDEATVTAIGGLSAAFVVDNDTYSATGSFDATGTLSIRNVATHVLPAGDGYDLVARLPIVAGASLAAPSIDGRTYPDLALPAGAGKLLLGGGLDPSSVVVDRLVDLAGGTGGDIVVLTAGYAKPEDARHDAKAYAYGLTARGADATWFVLDRKTNVAAATAAIGGADAILLTAPDPSTVGSALATSATVIDAVEAAWFGGAAVLADDAAASAVSAAYASDPRPGPSTGAIEAAAIAEFRPDETTITTGLGWADLALEPGIVSHRHWGRLYNLAGEVAFSVGVDTGTALEFGAGGATVVGDSVVIVLDGRQASFGVGSNGALAARWIVLDAFVAGDTVAP
jgi:cyanophycinase